MTANVDDVESLQDGSIINVHGIIRIKHLQGRILIDHINNCLFALRILELNRSNNGLAW